MAKKNRKPKAKRNQRAGNRQADNNDAAKDARRLHEIANRAARKVDGLSGLPLAKQKEAIRRLLVEIGTDVARNEGDATGDGDQTPIASYEQRDIAHHIFSKGGDMEQHVATKSMARFALGCMVGSLRHITEMINEVKKSELLPYSKSAAMLSLLEKSETSMRLTPLLLIVSAGKTIIGDFQDFQGVAKLLLKHGASPVAKDVLGKTVCHYGAGMMATKMTLDVVDMCISAARSHHMYGKEVRLHGLKTRKMNGRSGMVGGYDTDSGRRSVYLEEDQKEVWIKTENIELTESVGEEHYPPLTDIQDRMGRVSLHEICMPEQVGGGPERVDVAEFLLRRHNASIHAKEVDGISPLEMCSGIAQRIGKRGVAELIMESATMQARRTTKARRQGILRCTKCEMDLGEDAHLCSRCRVTRYCGRECQVAHWKHHKKECKDLAAISSGVKLDPPSKMMTIPPGSRSFSMSYKGGAVGEEVLKYRKPDGVEHDKKFVVKVQAGEDCSPILVYDRTRQCYFILESGQAGHQEILAEIRNEPAWQGRKTFMKASFDRSGRCTMYPETTGVKAHYTW